MTVHNVSLLIHPHVNEVKVGIEIALVFADGVFNWLVAGYAVAGCRLMLLTAGVCWHCLDCCRHCSAVVGVVNGITAVRSYLAWDDEHWSLDLVNRGGQVIWSLLTVLNLKYRHSNAIALVGWGEMNWQVFFQDTASDGEILQNLPACYIAWRLPSFCIAWRLPACCIAWRQPACYIAWRVPACHWQQSTV